MVVPVYHHDLWHVVSVAHERPLHALARQVEHKLKAANEAVAAAPNAELGDARHAREVLEEISVVEELCGLKHLPVRRRRINPGRGEKTGLGKGRERSEGTRGRAN